MLARRVAVGAAGLFAAAVLVVCALFVWPTVYKPIPIQPPQPREGNTFNLVGARQNRLTGDVEWLVYPDGWMQPIHPGVEGWMHGPKTIEKILPLYGARRR
jgi:hypothetical protein